jgi:hypothetical protein
MTMSNERDNYAVKAAPGSIPLQTSGPFVAVTPSAMNPDARAAAAFYKTLRKDLETRDQRDDGR